MNLRETQEEIIEELLSAKREKGVIRSASEYNSERRRLLAKIDGGGPFTTVREQESFTDARSFNETFREIEADLKTVFREISRISESSTSHKRLGESFMNSLRSRIDRLGQSAQAGEFLAGRRGADEQRYLSFSDEDHAETDGDWYRERDGEPTPPGYRFEWSPEEGVIQLPVVSSLNNLIGPGGTRLGTIKVIRQMDDAYRQSDELTSIEKAIDNDPGSYWSESVLMDAPVRTSLDLSRQDIDYGVLVEVEVSFDHVTELNEISMDPVLEYPMDLVDIRSYLSDEEEEGESLLHKTETLEGSYRLRFPAISAKRIRLLFNQRHYLKKDILASTKDSNQRKIWESVRSGDKDSLPLTGVVDAEGVLSFLTEEEFRHVTKYEYQYGLYDLSFKRNEFGLAGIHVSTPISIGGNAHQVRISSDEYHPEVAGVPAFTSIEYSVHDGKGWRDLLPVGQSSVEGELLRPKLVNGQYQAVTRFPVREEATILRNGLPAGNMVMMKDDRTVIFGEYDPSSIYTISYEPSGDAWHIDFLELARNESGEVEPNQLEETFNGTDDRGVIRLKNHPFVDRDKLNQLEDGYDPSILSNEYLPIKVTLVDSNGYRIEQPYSEGSNNMQVRNRTDYLGTGEVFMDPFNDHDSFYQYVVEGDEIRFNTKIPDSTRIIVEYPYLVSTLRVRSILRRNFEGMSGLTPALKSYDLHIMTLK